MKLVIVKTVRKIKRIINNKITIIKNRANGSIFDDTNQIRDKVTLYNSKIGKYTDINRNTNISHTIIGNYANVSWDVEICPRSHIYTNFTTHDFVYTKNEHVWKCNKPYNGYLVQIGNDVWIGCKCIILPGVNVGNGAVVAAGSVVTKSIPPYAVVGGNPCKFIKWRFDKETINKLEASKWYEKDPEEIIYMKDDLENIVKFNIDAFKENYFKIRKDLI